MTSPAVYKESYNGVLQSYQKWKRNAVEEDLATKRDTCIIREFLDYIEQSMDQADVNSRIAAEAAAFKPSEKRKSKKAKANSPASKI